MQDMQELREQEAERLLREQTEEVLILKKKKECCWPVCRSQA
jgi:hypothetical protein